jgi:hypothetical protein
MLTWTTHGKMLTLCGVGVSVAILSSRLRKGQHYCTVCSRHAKTLAVYMVAL